MNNTLNNFVVGATIIMIILGIVLIIYSVRTTEQELNDKQRKASKKSYAKA